MPQAGNQTSAYQTEQTDGYFSDAKQGMILGRKTVSNASTEIRIYTQADHKYRNPDSNRTQIDTYVTEYKPLPADLVNQGAESEAKNTSDNPFRVLLAVEFIFSIFK